mgnify:CR=1 FL=1
MKKTNRAYCILLFFLMSVLSSAVVYGGGSSYSWKPNVGGTFRGKFEYQTDVDNGRFQVRDARVNVKGRPFSLFEYKLEVNLSDKGVIRAHDLFGRFHFCDVASLAAGQFRVPISVDAARAPHVRLFANRSFVGKQIGNVYDVGVKGTYVWAKIGLTAELGVYNGKGSAPSDREWQTKFLYVGHLKYRKSGLTVNLSGLTMKPDVVRMNLYDVCMSYEYQRFFLEGEYLFKHFSAGDILLLQNEINHLAILIEQAFEKGMQIYLNPSPVTEQLKEISLDKISCLILNEIEAADLCAAEWKKQKQVGTSLPESPEECARALHSLHCSCFQRRNCGGSHGGSSKGIRYCCNTGRRLCVHSTPGRGPCMEITITVPSLSIQAHRKLLRHISMFHPYSI